MARDDHVIVIPTVPTISIAVGSECKHLLDHEESTIVAVDGHIYAMKPNRSDLKATTLTTVEPDRVIFDLEEYYIAQ